MLIRLPIGPVLIERNIKIVSFPSDLRILFDDDEAAFFVQILNNEFPAEVFAKQRLAQYDKYRDKHKKGIISVWQRDTNNIAKIVYSPEKLNDQELVQFFDDIGVKIELIPGHYGY